MNEGAFALIDCLGFKGIWKKTDPTILIRKLSRIEQTVSAEIHPDKIGYAHLSFGPIKTNVRLLSDTVAISLQYEPQEGKAPDRPQQNYLVALICHAVIQVLNLFLDGEPPLVLRGCVTYGEHLSEGNFLAGPAVDEAAEHMSIADGAFVWLLPSTHERYWRFVARSAALLTLAPPELIVKSWQILKERGYPVDWALSVSETDGAEAAVKAFAETLTPVLNLPLVIDHRMPLKTGARLQCGVLNPLVPLKSEAERRHAIETYSKVISGDRVDLWLKHQHTIEFLEIADAACATFRNKISDSTKKEDDHPKTD